ncbi:hypothetical protein RZ532_08510 [Nitratireductor aquimarinus]|uniref:hypothetical protein n=1 Tax=Nitratireductor aquimarinus TaxID=889300 RepID=UPI002936293C|nr:hypothetical protein [Nitratireductor aquimarinus]MDV2966013.1 hypothetical protein [Nitratireductor aquimarinus]
MTTDAAPDAVTDNRTDDTARRQRWREAQARYYARRREQKLEMIEHYRREHPDRYRTSRNQSLKRTRRGIQRAYRKTLS